MDIDNILSGAIGQTAAQETSDLQALVRAWVTERPEILPWPDSLMKRALQSINHQIDKHALYILKTASLCLQAHFHSTFLQFPTSLQNSDDTAGGISMVEQPGVDKVVFLKALRHIHVPMFVEGTDMGFQTRKGDVYVVWWSANRELVLDGDAELI
ncbi:GINS complex subunit [Pseudocyphellaria aurata]|nr:GINS complex subunit [Pseudocyphellaria aurata]